MKINITKKQYWDLLRATYMADWMANAICEADMKQDKGIKEIRNFVFSFAKDFGYEKYAEYDDYLKDYVATLDLDDEPEVRELIDRYDEHSFWEEATELLGERDYFEKYTKEELETMTHEERIDKLWECEAKWGEEFEKHGIDRLRVVDMKMRTEKEDKKK